MVAAKSKTAKRKSFEPMTKAPWVAVLIEVKSTVPFYGVWRAWTDTKLSITRSRSGK